LRWPLPAEISEAQLEAALFAAALGKDRDMEAHRLLPDFAHIREELQPYKHTTRQLPWGEYWAARRANSSSP
jgi:hypothetical protein